MMASHLYKSGELWLLYIENCIIEGLTTDAICIVKYETKETILQFKQLENNYDILKQEGVAINKINKGCLIFNTKSEDGYVCSVIDNGAKKGEEAKFWIDDFLHVTPIKNSYHQTKAIADAITTYVSSEMPKSFDVSRSDQACIVNNSLNELKTTKEVDIEEMKSRIFVDDNVRKDFDRYFDNYQVDHDIVINGEVEVVKSAIKRNSFGSMTTIKLDQNFDIKIHGGNQLIEKGYDSELKMSYYKLYFKNEK